MVRLYLGVEGVVCEMDVMQGRPCVAVWLCGSGGRGGAWSWQYYFF